MEPLEVKRTTIKSKKTLTLFVSCLLFLICQIILVIVLTMPFKQMHMAEASEQISTMSTTLASITIEPERAHELALRELNQYFKWAATPVGKKVMEGSNGTER